MREWIQQRSTWMGIGTAILAVLTVLTDQDVLDPIYLTIVASVLSAVGLGVKDKQLQ